MGNGNASATDAKAAWLARLGVRLVGANDKHLTLGLTPDEVTRCNAYLDAHFDVVVAPGALGLRLEEWLPTLDRRAVPLPAVVTALWPQTLAGSAAARGLDPQAQLTSDTRSQLTDLVQRRFDVLARDRARAAMEAAGRRGAANVVGQGGGRSDTGRSPRPDSTRGAGPDQDGSVAVGRDGIETQATLTFKSDGPADLGEVTFTVHIGPGGRLTQLEADLAVLRTRLSAVLPGVRDRIARFGVRDISATLSVNAEGDFRSDAMRTVFDGVQAQLKGEVEVEFGPRNASSSVGSIKLSGSFGTGGGAMGVAIEFRIPGT